MFLVHVAHETAGAARIRHSLRPLNLEEGETICKTSGASRRENAKVRLDGGATTNSAVVPALSSDAQLRIGGPITTGCSFANGLCYRVFIERSRGMAQGEYGRFDMRLFRFRVLAD
jgi:hypothetical protein